jgi:DDE superfamily endonuclease
MIALTYLRRNRVQWELAETYGVSQSTISRAISAITPPLARALARFVPVAEELVPGRQYIVDGTLLPCWSWASQPRLYSGKHKTTGMNVPVVCTLDGELVWISDPVEGARHDVFCLDESGALHTLDPRDWTGDKGYVGRGMLTPIKRSKHMGFSTLEYPICVQHETFINLAFQGRPVTILCPYDAAQLEPDVLHDAGRTHHPVLIENGKRRVSTT